jgi:hypothetical protein
MMGQILFDLEHPESVEAEEIEEAKEAVEAVELEDAEKTDEQVSDAEQELPVEAESSVTVRRTVSQALRDWDISSVERTIIDHGGDGGGTDSQAAGDERSSNRPWYLRRGSR